MREAYLAELTKIAGEYDAALLPMAENYLLDLRRLAVRLTGLKDNAGTETTRKEAARFMKALVDEPDPFETVPEMPAEVLVAERAFAGGPASGDSGLSHETFGVR